MLCEDSGTSFRKFQFRYDEMVDQLQPDDKSSEETLRTLFEKLSQEPRAESVQSLLKSVPLEDTAAKEAGTFVDFFLKVSKPLERASFELIELIEAGPRVHFTCNLEGVNRDGTSVRWKFSGTALCRNGFIEGGCCYGDFFSYLQALGSLPHQDVGTPPSGSKPLRPLRVTNPSESFSPAMPLASLQPLLTLYDVSGYGAVVTDRENKIIEGNQTFARLVSRESKELPGVSFQDLVFVDDRPAEIRCYQELTTGQNSFYSNRFRLFRRDALVWAHHSAIPLSPVEGRFLRMLFDTSLLDDVVRFQEEERALFAQELHDTVSQDVAALAMYLQNPAMEIGSSPCKAVAERILKATERLLENSRGPAYESPTLRAALESLSERCLKDHGVRVNLHFTGGAFPSDTRSFVAYRVIQEAVQNIVRHSQAEQAQVEVNLAGPELCGTITDDGCGFDRITNSRGFGLQNMAQRCKLHGGTFQVKSTTGKGTSISFRLPRRPRP